MKIWALADLHLSFGVPHKSMDVFGEAWQNHAHKVQSHWRALVQEEDLVLIPGDISWAKYLEEAVVDLKWIDQLPGTKVMIRGNHDYWWGSIAKIKNVLPPSIHVIQNDVFEWQGIAIAGARLWDTPEYDFSRIIEYVERPEKIKKEEPPPSLEEEKKIFQRELGRLEMSLKCLPSTSKMRIVMTHYPPIGLDLAPSLASSLLEKYKVQVCVFGHLHSVRPGKYFGSARGVDYHLVSCDYLDFTPLQIVEI